jgi:hypothetical protein
MSRMSSHFIDALTASKATRRKIAVPSQEEAVAFCKADDARRIEVDIEYADGGRCKVEAKA